RLESVEAMSIYIYVCGARVMRGRIDDADGAPLRDFSGHVCPMSAVVSRDLDQAIVGAGPKCSFLHRRFGEREHRVVIFNRRDVVGERTATRLLFGLIVAR